MARPPSFLLAALMLLGPAVAAADQCEAISPEIARWAQRLAPVGSTFLMRCEPCDESAPTPPMQVRRVEVKKWSGDSTRMTLSINGKAVDLAYTFIQTGSATFTNLGLLTGCGASGVSTFLGANGQAAGSSPGSTGAGAGADSTVAPVAPPDRSPVGIPSCDLFVKKYEACVRAKFPQASRKAAFDAIDQMRDAWRQGAATPEGKAALEPACKQAADAMKEAMTSMGCAW